MRKPNSLLQNFLSMSCIILMGCLLTVILQTPLAAVNSLLVFCPHQIRGSLFHFSQMTLVGHSSNSCTACCSTVVSEYQKRGIEFLLQAINHPTYLEDLTGLTE
ncbi:hypothetical protein DKX38_017194 [Salix brachista]|uniref:Uncharacterized protein n=1 Tax=Salix brachista TaxID=2182728 RepID=A0A5N5KVD7_9ROSI|nr:hypothetical protein DKX38_017194 [Salix brachista]